VAVRAAAVAAVKHLGWEVAKAGVGKRLVANAGGHVLDISTVNGEERRLWRDGPSRKTV
jgi:hypothetical protein